MARSLRSAKWRPSAPSPDRASRPNHTQPLSSLNWFTISSTAKTIRKAPQNIPCLAALEDIAFSPFWLPSRLIRIVRSQLYHRLGCLAMPPSERFASSRSYSFQCEGNCHIEALCDRTFGRAGAPPHQAWRCRLASRSSVEIAQANAPIGAQPDTGRFLACERFWGIMD